MTTSFRAFTLALCAALPLAGCSREEPQPAAAPVAATNPAVPPVPAAAPADAPAEDAPNVAGDPKVMQNPTAAEPGFLTAFADADETIGAVPFTVKLTVDVIENTGTPPYTFIWDFGDATEFSTEQSPAHTYKIPGSFRASVIIRDSKGEVDQDFIDLAVSDPDAPDGLTAEQLMQQVPLEEIMRQAREAAAANAAGEQAPPADSEE